MDKFNIHYPKRSMELRFPGHFTSRPLTSLQREQIPNKLHRNSSHGTPRAKSVIALIAFF